MKISEPNEDEKSRWPQGKVKDDKTYIDYLKKSKYPDSYKRSWAARYRWVRKHRDQSKQHVL